MDNFQRYLNMQRANATTQLEELQKLDKPSPETSYTKSFLARLISFYREELKQWAKAKEKAQ